MITAYASLETVRHALTHGAFEYLIKPFSRQDLEDVVHRALDAPPGRPRRPRAGRASGRGDAAPVGARPASSKKRRVARRPSSRSASCSSRSCARSPARSSDSSIRNGSTGAVTEQIRAALGYDGVADRARGAGRPRQGRHYGHGVRHPATRQGPLGYLGHRQSPVPACDRSARERELLEMLSEYLAIALRNSRLYGEIADTKRSLEQLIASAGDAIITVTPEDRIDGLESCRRARSSASRRRRRSAAPITRPAPRGDYGDARRRARRGHADARLSRRHGHARDRPRPMDASRDALGAATGDTAGSKGSSRSSATSPRSAKSRSSCASPRS